ncbi:MAG TPA: glucose 1-dehydrogenase [Gemmataceae bacterium]|nr:glucose 1-dehydrogenase [Gemmataceae bacterium]
MSVPPDLFDLKGRRALITGASRGIGLAIAHGLAQRGAAIVITGRKADTLGAAAEQLRAGGADAQPMVCHQGEPAAIAQLFQELDKQGKPVDIAVINAATNPVMGPLLEVDLAAWQKIVDVNLTGALATAQQAARRMAARKKGSLVIISSIAGIDPMPSIAAYSVSKAGLLGMMRGLAKELGPFGVRANAIAPGLIETKFSAALFQNKKAYEYVVGNVPLGRHGQPEDIVGAAVFLASDASAYITGQTLVVDGGGRV